ncbi:TPA: hypothetical protein ACGPBD_000817 [Streptococcus suis]
MYRLHNYHAHYDVRDLTYHAHQHRLSWSSRQGLDVFIIKAQFGLNIAGQLDSIFTLLDQMNFDFNKADFQEVMSGYAIRAVTSAQNALAQGCNITPSASSYMVLAYEKSDEDIVVYRPFEMNANRLGSARVDVRSVLRVSSQRVIKTSKSFFLFNKSEETDYFEICLKNESDISHYLGQLYYMVNTIKIPLGAKILEKGMFCVKSDSRPEILTDNPGIEIEMSEK